MLPGMSTVRSSSTRYAFLAAALSIVSAPLFAKDKELALKDAPEGVQATIKKTTDAGATLEKVEVEEESGGTQYGAKITDKNGVRWEIIMDSTGRVLKTQQKKNKN
jgi:uncharacterized glyoxalase superfamily protein PhnB